MIDRRGFIAVAAASAAVPRLARAAPGGGDMLATLPRNIYPAPDLPRERTEGWMFVLLLGSDAPGEVTPETLLIETLVDGAAVKRESLAAPAVAALQLSTGSPVRFGDEVARPGGWPLRLRIRGREPTSLAVTALRTTLTYARGGRRAQASLDVPIRRYAQRTALIFPFRGPGIVTQAGALNGGHRNRSGLHAIDAMALAANYGPQTGAAFATNADLAGYGRELVAPAAGVVRLAVRDRPDQPKPGESDEAYHADGLKGAGDPGNHVVIDHGNGEFSLVAHLKAGSVRVVEGEAVRQGQPIGALGNSGDSFAPHVHYQLQDGPDWQAADALPCRFANIDAYPLNRGEYFEAG